jgi:hypothetical protein
MRGLGIQGKQHKIAVLISGETLNSNNFLKTGVQISVLAGYTVGDLFLFRLRMGVRASEQHKNRIETQQTNNGHGGINEGIHLQKL